MRIGFSRCGGLGDGVVATAPARSIRLKYPESFITAYLLGSPYEIFKRNEDIDSLVEAQCRFPKGVLKEDVIKDKYPWDLWFDLKPIPRVFVRDGIDIELPESVCYWREALSDIHLGYIDSCRELTKFGLRQIDLISQAIGVEPSKPRVYLYKREDIGNYATLCNEAWGEAPSKSYPFWADIVEQLDLPVDQVGEFRAETIGNCINRAGLLTFRDSCRLVAGAAFHLGIEGFWNHFCEALSVPRVIVFGPTPESFFGYDSAKNVCGDCGDCWWKTKDWMLRCPRGFEYSQRPCMHGLQPQILSCINDLYSGGFDVFFAR